MAWVLFVEAEQHPVALTLQVGEPLEVGDGRHQPVDRCDRWDVVGHQVVVGHRHERMVDADHAADPPRPQTARVDDVVAFHPALLGLDPPCAGRQAFEPEHPVVLDDGRAAPPSGDRVGARRPVRVEVAFVGVEQRAVDPDGVDDRHHLCGLLGRDDVRVVVTLRAEPCELLLQPLPTFLATGELEAAGHLEADVDAALFLDRRVHRDRVELERRDPRVGIDRVEATGGVPRGARGELFPLEQECVGLAAERKVIEDARSPRSPRRPRRSRTDPSRVNRLRAGRTGATECMRGPHHGGDLGSVSPYLARSCFRDRPRGLGTSRLRTGRSPPRCRSCSSRPRRAPGTPPPRMGGSPGWEMGPRVRWRFARSPV